MYFENLVALYIAVEKQCTQEMAFQYLDKFAEGIIDKKPRFKYSDEDIQDINKFKQQGLSCEEIAKIYFTTTNSIYGALQRYKKSCRSSQIKN